MAKKSESKRSAGRVGQLRCHNCSERFAPPPGVEQASCPNCGFAWEISWKDKLAKIRKPVWESWERQLAEMDRAKGSGGSE